eukprot:scaffold40104_cov222-Skeletonema_dohrnii-CCMP3373.AAC.2
MQTAEGEQTETSAGASTVRRHLDSNCCPACDTQTLNFNCTCSSKTICRVNDTKTKNMFTLESVEDCAISTFFILLFLNKIFLPPVPARYALTTLRRMDGDGGVAIYNAMPKRSQSDLYKTTMTCSSMTPITMSIQPTYGDGGPAWLANKLGYFEELCLNATLLVYQSGAPQVNEISKWSVGNAGSPPNVQGWTQGVLKTVGINNDESSTNALVANAEGIASWASILAAGTLGDTRMTINPNSTGEFVVEECLKKYNVSFDPVTNFIYNTTQEGVFSSLSDPDGNDFGSFWAPTLYSAVETWGKESIICSGDDAGAHVAGGLMVSNEADETNTETAALAIAAYLKGV